MRKKIHMARVKKKFHDEPKVIVNITSPEVNITKLNPLILNRVLIEIAGQMADTKLNQYSLRITCSFTRENLLKKTNVL